MPSSAPSMGPREWAMLGLLSIVWGATFVFAELALRDVSPFQLVLARVALAALALHVWLRLTGQRLPGEPRTWGAFLVLGLLNNVLPFSLIFWGQTRITGGLASILNATTPLWAVFLAHLLTADERLTPARLAGVLIGLGGAVLVIGPAALRSLGAEALPQLAIILASASYALAGIYGRRFRGLPPLVIATGQLTCSTLLLAPAILWLDPPDDVAGIGGTTVVAVLGLALLSTAFAYSLYFRILATAGATNVVLVTFLIPGSAMLLGAIILDERVGLQELGGMALIGVGLALIDSRLPRRLRRHWQRSPA